MPLLEVHRTLPSIAPVPVRRSDSFSTSDCIAGTSARARVYGQLDRQRRPAVLMLPDRALVHTNAAYRALDAATLPVTVVDGRLAGFKGRASHGVNGMVTEALRGATVRALVAASSSLEVAESAPWDLWTCSMSPADPAPAGVAGRTRLVQVVFWRLVPDLRQLARLAEVFRLTEAELRVVWLLVEGRRPQCIAELCDTALTTVRTHLQAIYGKTGVRSQTGLVRLALTAALAD